MRAPPAVWECPAEVRSAFQRGRWEQHRTRTGCLAAIEAGDKCLNCASNHTQDLKAVGCTTAAVEQMCVNAVPCILALDKDGRLSSDESACKQCVQAHQLICAVQWQRQERTPWPWDGGVLAPGSPGPLCRPLFHSALRGQKAIFRYPQ